MANEIFEPGDVVKLKSGGPAMVVVRQAENVTCRWWNSSSNTYDFTALNAFELKPASADR